MDDVLSANLEHTAKSLCSPSSYATRKQNSFPSDDPAKDHSQSLGQKENNGAPLLPKPLAQAPTPSRPVRRMSQCLQGFTSSPADIMTTRHRRHASLPIQPEPKSPCHLIQSPVDKEQAEVHRAYAWKMKANGAAKQERRVDLVDWSNGATVTPLSLTGPTITKTPPPSNSLSTTPPTVAPLSLLSTTQAAPWSPDLNTYYMDQQQQVLLRHQQQQQQVTGATAAAALWQQQQIMYHQMMSQQQQMQQQHNLNPNNYNYMPPAPQQRSTQRARHGHHGHHDRRRDRRDRHDRRDRRDRRDRHRRTNSFEGSSSSKPKNVVLEQWKLSENRKQWSLNDVMGNTTAFAQDTTGTHFLQACLDEAKQGANGAEIINVYDELTANMSTLILHNTGNWSVKKLVEVVGADQLEHFFHNHIVGRTPTLAYHVHGARVLKAALIRAAELKTETLINVALVLLTDLSTDLVRAMCHESATHIFQRAFNVLTTNEQREKIVSKIIECGENNSGDLQRIGTHTYGSRALQCLIGTCSELLAPTVLKVAPSLAQSAAGNFVLQSMLQNGNSKTRKNLVQAATFHLGQFACNKHASHFVERCIDMASEDELKKMVTTMSLPPPSLPPTSPPVMVVMCNNNYANFVMGSIVSRLCRWNDFLQKEQLSLIMQSWEPQMRATNVGDKTYSQSMAALGKNQ